MQNWYNVSKVCYRVGTIQNRYSFINLSLQCPHNVVMYHYKVYVIICLVLFLLFCIHIKIQAIPSKEQ